MDLELRKYQKELLAYHLREPRSIDTSACGTGKSAIMSRWIYTRNLIDGCKTIFIMPSSLFIKNKDDVLLWSGWSEDEVRICTGTPKKREEIYKNSKVKCFIMSGETFASEWEKLKQFQPSINAVCVDEVQMLFSTHTSKRTQSMYRSSRVIKYFLFCSGTVIDGRYSSLYPLFAVIEPRWYGSYNNFLRYHGVYNSYGSIVAWTRPERIKKILNICSKGVTLKDAYPNQAENIITVEKCFFDENHKQAYKELEEDALLELRDEYLETNNPLVKSIKCRSLLSSPESFDLPKPIKINGKDEMIKTHLERALMNNERVLIFSCFNSEQERLSKLAKKLGCRVDVINGNVSGLKRGEIDKRFREHELDVVIGSPSCMCVGFNMEYVSEIIFSNLDYKNSNFIQGIYRGNRGTRKEPLPVYILSYGTKVEKRIMNIITRKENELKKVFEQ